MCSACCKAAIYTMPTRSRAASAENRAVQRSSIQQRLTTVAIIVTAALLVCQIYPPLLALVIGNLATVEYYNITCSNKSNTRLCITLLQYNIAAVCTIHSQRYMQFALLCVIYSSVVIELLTVKKLTPQTFITLCTNIFGHVYITALWSHTVLLLQPVHKYVDYLNVTTLTDAQYQITTIIFVVFATANGENGGLLFGTLYGRGTARLAAHISPNKSLIGGVAQLFGTLATCILYAYCASIKPAAYNVYDGIALGMLLGVGGITGDLFESYLKRCYSIKDSNSVVTLPGIGGVLDRIDGLLFNFVFTYYYYTYRGFIT